MKNYTYDSVTGPVTIEVDEDWEKILRAEDAADINAKRKHTRPDHKYAGGAPLSLEGLFYEGSWLADRRGGISDAEFMMDLERAMQMLTPLQQRYAEQVLIHGCSYVELARADGVSERAVRKHIELAVPKLKKYFS